MHTGGKKTRGAGGAHPSEKNRAKTRVAADAKGEPEVVVNHSDPGPVRFSFLMPVYATAPHEYFEVSTALKSVLDQTVKSFEIIMLCDGPDDIMREVWRGAQGDIKGGKDIIRYYEHPHRGIRGGHHMIDQGVDAARGEFICILNGDNSIEPDYIEKMYDPEADIVTCQVVLHDHPGLITSGRGWQRGRIDRLNYAIRRSVAVRVKHLMHVDADYDWLMDCWDHANHRREVRVTHVDKVLGHHR